MPPAAITNHHTYYLLLLSHRYCQPLHYEYSSSYGSMDNDSSDSYVGPLAADFRSAGRDIQNRSRRERCDFVEGRSFKEYFGTTATIVCLLWRLLVQHDLLPKKAQVKHLLWALFFMKVYPKQEPACSIAGGSNGAVDPKTFRKWVWLFIPAIAELELVVVSTSSSYHHTMSMKLISL
jgi:hypothetical protein